MANININNVTIGGRLTHEIELEVTPNGTHVTQFNVAINRMKEGTDFVRCIAWKQSADFLEKYARKGDAVIVEGRIQVDQYKNKDGKNTSVTKVLANRVTLIPKTNADQQKRDSSYNGTYNSSDTAGYADNLKTDSDDVTPDSLVILSDDLPF